MKLLFSFLFTISLFAQGTQQSLLISQKIAAGGAPIAQVATVSAAGLSGATTGTITTSAGQIAIAAVATFGGTACSETMSDSKGNSWNCDVSNDGQASKVAIWCSVLSNVGTLHTFTITGSAVAISVSTYSGTAGACSSQTSNANNGGAASLPPGSITPGADGALCVTSNWAAQYAGDYDWAVTSGYTLIHTIQSVGGTNIAQGSWYQIQTTATATNPPWAGSNNEVASLAACYAAP